MTELGKQRFQVGLVHGIGQVAHIQLLGHDQTPDERQNDPRGTFRVEKKGVSGETQLAGKAKVGSKDRIKESQRCYPVVRPSA